MSKVIKEGRKQMFEADVILIFYVCTGVFVKYKITKRERLLLTFGITIQTIMTYTTQSLFYGLSETILKCRHRTTWVMSGCLSLKPIWHCNLSVCAASLNAGMSQCDRHRHLSLQILKLNESESWQQPLSICTACLCLLLTLHLLTLHLFFFVFLVPQQIESG